MCKNNGFFGNVLDLLKFYFGLMFITKKAGLYNIFYFTGAFLIGYNHNNLKHFYLISLLYLLIGGYISCLLMKRAYVDKIYD